MLLAFCFYCGEMLPFPHLIACDDKEKNICGYSEEEKMTSCQGLNKCFKVVFDMGSDWGSFQWNSSLKINEILLSLLVDCLGTWLKCHDTRHWTHTFCLHSLRPNFVDMRRRLDSHLHVHSYQAVTTAATTTQTQDFSLQLSWSRFSS